MLPAERLQLISRLQSQGEGYFRKGLFPTFRIHRATKISRPDDTFFFSALIVYTLQKLIPFLNVNERKVVDKIIQNVILLYPLYRNKDGLPTYNFWQQAYNKHFPNGKILSKFDHFRLPDDADDTVMVYLTDNIQNGNSIYLQEKLSAHANTVQRIVKNTPTEFQSLKAYTTWFGKNMPSEFDFCVMCNIMVWVKANGLPLNEHDVDTFTFIKKVIQEEKYLQNPFLISPTYGQVEIIYYHFSRVFELYPEIFQDVKDQTVLKVKALFDKSKDSLKKIILGTSLIRMGGKPDYFEMPEQFHSKLYWFRAGMMSTYENKLSQWLAPFPIFHLSYYCEAYIQALALEFEILRSKF